MYLGHALCVWGFSVLVLIVERGEKRKRVDRPAANFYQIFSEAGQFRVRCVGNFEKGCKHRQSTKTIITTEIETNPASSLKDYAINDGPSFSLR